jgi:hypothetical protein
MQAQGGVAGQAMRDKDWDECGIEERVQRLHIVALRNDQRLDAIGEVAHEAREIAVEHSHDHLGRVVRLVREMRNKLVAGLAGARRNLLD